MKAQISNTMALVLRLVTLLALSSTSVATADRDGIRSLDAQDTMIAARNQISFKRFLRSNAAIRPAENTIIAEERTSGWFTKLLQPFRSAEDMFIELGLHNSNIQLDNKKFFEWVSLVKKKYPKSERKAADKMTRVLSQHSEDLASYLVENGMKQVEANELFSRLKLPTTNGDELLKNQGFVNWIAIVRERNPRLNDAVRVMVTSLSESYSIKLSRSLAAKGEFIRLQLETGDGDELLKNQGFYDWITIVKHIYPNSDDAARMMVERLSDDHGPDKAKKLYDKGLEQIDANNEFLRLKLQTGNGDELLKNQKFYKWVDIVMDSKPRDDAARDDAARVMVTGLSKYYDYDLAEGLVAKGLRQQLANKVFNGLRLRKENGVELLKDQFFYTWIAIVRGSNSPEDAARVIDTTLSRYFYPDDAKELATKGVQQEEANEQFIRLKLPTENGDELLKNQGFSKWIAIVRERNSRLDDAARVMVTSLSKFYDNELSKILVAKGEFIRLQLQTGDGDEILANQGFSDWIAIVNKIYPHSDDATRVVKRLSKYRGPFKAKELVAKGQNRAKRTESF